MTMPSRVEQPGPGSYDIGAAVECTDGSCGELSRIVVDPVARAVTHLVVEPPHRHSLSRLVPVRTVAADAGEDGEIRLRCDLAGFHAFQHAQENDFIPADDYEDSNLYSPGGPAAPSIMFGPYYAPTQKIVTTEHVPLGGVEIRRGDHIHASDGSTGRVRGLVVKAEDQHVTHLLVSEGHMWGAKDVAIPFGAVDSIAGDGIRVSLSKHQIADLPQVRREVRKSPAPRGPGHQRPNAR